MNPLSPSSDVPLPTDHWRRIDAALDAIVRLAATEPSAHVFYEAVLRQVVTSLPATTGAIWIQRDESPLQPSCQVRIDSSNSGLPSTQQPAGKPFSDPELVRQVMTDNQSRIVQPHAVGQHPADAASPPPLLQLLSPWQIGGSAAGLIEVFQPVATAADAASAQLRFLDAVAEILADFDRDQQLNRLRQQHAESGRVEQFYRQIHATLDRRAICFHIANDGRRLLGCDRVSVLRRKGTRCQLLAASGVDIIDRRSNAARKLEALGIATLALGEPLWYGDQSDGLAPQIEDRLHDYIDESQARQLGIIPLVIPHAGDDDDDRIVGALVIEHFSASRVDRLSERSNIIAPQCALALDNASQYERVPRWLRAVCAAGWLLGAKQLPKTLTALCALAMIVATLALVPADFEIEARGQLQPQIRDDVFAPIDGVVDPEHLRVSHGQPVKKDEVLLALNSPQLDLDFRRVFGELNTARKRRDALEAKRLQNPRQTADEQQSYALVTQEQEELAQTIAGLQQQVQILQEQQNELTVKSAIAGQVITWDVQELLDTRPVQRGQVLLTVAQTSGAWVLELDLPDEDVGHVLNAQDHSTEDLVVTYQLATEPGVNRYGRIERIAMTTEFDAHDEPVVRVIVRLDDDKIAERRPGATVRAKLHCGRRSLGFVWFHDLFDYVNSWILF